MAVCSQDGFDVTTPFKAFVFADATPPRNDGQNGPGSPSLRSGTRSRICTKDFSSGQLRLRLLKNNDS